MKLRRCSYCKRLTWELYQDVGSQQWYCSFACWEQDIPATPVPTVELFPEEGDAELEPATLTEEDMAWVRRREKALRERNQAAVRSNKQFHRR